MHQLSVLLLLGFLLAPRTSEAGLADQLKSGAAIVRVHLLYTDEEKMMAEELIHEAEHALEPPTEVDGFWARKWEVLKHPWRALNLVRSFQNIARVVRLSGLEEDPWKSELIKSSATMFAITHGSEFVTGVTMGTLEGVSGNFGQAIGWYGLALPGLYDVGCWVGQATLLLRPGRVGFNHARKIVVEIIGRGVERIGLPAIVDRFMERTDAGSRLLRAIERGERSGEFQYEMPPAELLELKISKRNSPVALLRFEEVEQQLILRSADIELFDGKPAKFEGALKEMGWNVRGAIKQSLKWIREGTVELLAAERTFVSAVEQTPERVRIHFRENAVAITPKRIRHPIGQICRRIIDDLWGGGNSEQLSISFWR